ncbi:hypothetical protein D3C87_1910450 [compost metagenome]
MSSTASLNVHVKSPLPRRPASVVTTCSTVLTLSMSATSTPVSIVVSKLLYAVPPTNALYELGTVSFLVDAK